MGVDNSKKVTEVKIYNQTYHVRSEDDPEYIRKLAEYVDRKMTEVSQNTPTVDTLRVAILAALNIANDYVTAKEELRYLEQDLLERSDRIKAVVEECCRGGVS